MIVVVIMIMITIIMLLALSIVKVKVHPTYDPYVGEVPVREATYHGHWHCEIGWPVPFLAAFISPRSPFAVG